MANDKYFFLTLIVFIFNNYFNGRKNIFLVSNKSHLLVVFFAGCNAKWFYKINFGTRFWRKTVDKKGTFNCS